MKKAFFFFGLLLLAACDPEEVEEQENINTVKILVKDGTTTVGTFQWTDPDGVGINLPRIDTLRLAPNKTYQISLSFWDASQTPNKDFTDEIVSESVAHLVLHAPSSGLNLSINNQNRDSNGRALGQTADYVTTAASTGTLRLLLKHEADKSAANPAATGETDVDVTFPCIIR